MQPKFDALYRALVTSNTDTSGLGKIKVQCPQISGIAEIRFAEPVNPQEYIPDVGTTVWVGFSGGDITKPFYLSNTAPSISVIQDWSAPTLATGFTGDGNSNGTPEYRVINILGSRKVEWKGGLNVTYPGSSIANGGDFLSSALPAIAIPTSRRTVDAACSATTSTSLSVKVDFNTTGMPQIVGTNTTTIQPIWVSLNTLSYFI